MIKDAYFTQMEVVHDQGYRLLQINLEGLNLEGETSLRLLLNEDVTFTLKEFEEMIPVIRGAYKLLGESIHQDILCGSRNGGG
jgi:hypothetical protein